MAGVGSRKAWPGARVLGAIFTASAVAVTGVAFASYDGAGRLDNGAAAHPLVGADLGGLPLYFVPNRGQADRQVDFYVQGSRTNAYFTPGGVTYRLTSGRKKNRRAWAVKLDFVGADRVTPVGRDRTSATVSYFKGPRSNWETAIPTYSEIVYRDLWPGIDLVYTGTGGALKYTFVVHPGADPSDIRLAYRGARSVEPDSGGGLKVATPIGSFTDEAPVSYQSGLGGRVGVDSPFALGPARRRRRAFGFNVGDYDPATTLVIDPTVLIYAGYIGGDGDDQGIDIAVDAAGNAYVTGTTTSAAATFPEKVGPSLTFGGQQDAFVAKVDPTGSSLVYAGYLGGTGVDFGNGIAVDGSGNAYVSGATTSGAGFPATVGPDLTFNGVRDAYVAKVNPTGSALIYAGFIGGSAFDMGQGIAVNGSGSAYVTGETESSEETFPETVGPDLTHNGTTDAYVAKVNSTGLALDYAGFIGGGPIDGGEDIALDGSGNAYMTGYSDSDENSFPVLVGPGLTKKGGFVNGDAIVVKVNPTGSALVYAGYIGGTRVEGGFGIAIDGAGSAFVSGWTTSSDFAVVGGPDLSHNGATGGQDAFVAKVNPSGSGLVYSGYIGGAGQDIGSGIALDSSGNAYVVGSAESTEASFPVVDGPDITHNGGFDAFVTKVDPSGSVLAYSGYIGGTGDDFGLGIATDAAGRAYVSGQTASSESFPVVSGPDTTYNGGPNDAFVAKIDSDATPSPPPRGSPSPSPSPSASRGASPSPSPSASRGASPSPSPSASRGASSSPASGSPSASRSSSASASSSDSASSPPGSPSSTPTHRRIDLESDHTKVRLGGDFVLTAHVQAAADCAAGVTVTFRRKILGTDAFVDVGTAVTDGNGFAKLRRKGHRGATYVADVDQTDICEQADSRPVTVLVRKKVTLRRSADVVARGETVRLTARVSPCAGHAGEIVELLKREGKSFSVVAHRKSNADCFALFFRKIWRDDRFRARSPAQDADHLAGRSRGVLVKVKRL